MEQRAKVVWKVFAGGILLAGLFLVGCKNPTTPSTLSTPVTPLAEGATRLQNFERFVKQEAATTAMARKKALDDAYKTFVGESVLIGMDDELFSEIRALDTEVASDSRSFEVALTARHTAIKTAVESLDWEKVDASPPSLVLRLQVLVDKLNQEAKDPRSLGRRARPGSSASGM